MEKAIVFTAKSEYARYRKPYTTTSALTYITLHPIAVKGLIGAALGFDRAVLFEATKALKVAIEVLSPPLKDLQSFNLISMKIDKIFRFPSNVEFLRDVSYRISVAGPLEHMDQLECVLKSRQYGFTPYLGASEHIAVLRYENTVEAKASEEAVECVHSIAPVAKGTIDFNQTGKIYTDTIPVENNAKRQYVQYQKVCFSDAGPLQGAFNDTWQVGKRNVYFL